MAYFALVCDLIINKTFQRIWRWFFFFQILTILTHRLSLDLLSTKRLRNLTLSSTKQNKCLTNCEKISSTVAKKTFSYCFLQMWAKRRKFCTGNRRLSLIVSLSSTRADEFIQADRNLRENELTVTLVQLQLSLAPAELANTRASVAAPAAARSSGRTWKTERLAASAKPRFARHFETTTHNGMVFYVCISFYNFEFSFHYSLVFCIKKNNILRRQNEWA